MRSSLRHIFHPTDLSRQSLTAFEHALRIALAARATLTIMHVTRGSEEEWDAFPGVREVLQRWGFLPDGAEIDALKGLGVKVRKVSAQAHDPVEACADHLERHPAQLLVMATGQPGVAPVWSRTSVAGRIAAHTRGMVLFLPYDAAGFVQSEDGKVCLKHVLVPVDLHPDPARSMVMADELCALIAPAEVEFTLYHAGKREGVPKVLPLERMGFTWHSLVKDQEPVNGILRSATDLSVDLVVMATQGRRGIKDALLGSTTEQVLASIEQPLLAVPA